MRIKIKFFALALFLIDAIVLIINIKYQDEIASVIPDLDSAKIFFYLGILFFITYLIFAKSRKVLTYSGALAIISFCVSLFFNLRLAKENYNRIQCNKGISEYYKYFEYDSCEKIKKRFEEDLINGELIYFQDAFNSNLKFEERLKDKHDIKLIGTSCTQFTSMECYNDLVKKFINKKEQEDN